MIELISLQMLPYTFQNGIHPKTSRLKVNLIHLNRIMCVPAGIVCMYGQWWTVRLAQDCHEIIIHENLTKVVLQTSEHFWLEIANFNDF